MDAITEAFAKGISANWMPGLVIVIILMPFWYISIYLFHKDFYHNSTNILKWCFCFCLSFIWFGIYSIWSALGLYKDSIHPEPVKSGVVPLLSPGLDQWYFGAGWMSIFVLAFTLPCIYLFKPHIKNFSYPRTLILIFSCIVLFIIVFAIYVYLYQRFS